MNTNINTLEREVDWMRVPVWEVSPDGYVGGFTTRPYKDYRGVVDIRRVIFLNALIPPTSEGFIYVNPVQPQVLKKFLEDLREVPYESFIGHPATASLLTKMMGISITTNRGEYTPKCGDLAIVARLKSRPPVGADMEVRPEDIQLLLVWYL
jgi:hypothetical protein